MHRFDSVVGLCAPALVAWLISSSVLAQATAPAGKAYLLQVTKGQKPNDIGSDDGITKMTIEKSAELGGDALKVVFSAGDSIGDKSAKVKNWKSFASLRFQTFNPSDKELTLYLNANHKRTTSFQTRVTQPFKVKPGKGEVVIGIDELSNVNGSAPDLSVVGKWWINCEQNETPTVFFGDLILEGGDAPAAAPGGLNITSFLPAGGFRVQGTIGDQKVDLTITPIGGSTANVAAPKISVAGDPKRLERIRAAKMPKIDKVIAFDTPEADAVLAALEVYPPDNPWNLVVSDWPLHPQSKDLIASVGTDKFLRGNEDMCFVIVPPNQPLIDVKLAGSPAECDPGPFPVPDSLPIEGFPKSLGKDGKPLSLAEAQRRPEKYDGDRHAIILDPTAGKLYEFFVMGKTKTGWMAEQSSVFNLRSNKLRPDGWTSADAAGLPIFPAIVRYDELARGEIEHPLRVTIRRSRKDYVYPATHHAGHGEDDNLPRMGERMRLRQDFDVTGFSPMVQTILRCLKKYGMFVADNGIEWAVSIAPDRRLPEFHSELRKVKGADFEVVVPPAGYEPPTH